MGGCQSRHAEKFPHISHLGFRKAKSIWLAKRQHQVIDRILIMEHSTYNIKPLSTYLLLSTEG